MTATSEAADDKRRRWPSPGVPARLVCLTVVPLLGLAFVVGILIDERRARADATEMTSREVDELRLLADLETGLTTEWLLSTALVRGTELGIGPDTLSVVFDLDVNQVMAESRATVSDALAGLADDPSWFSFSTLTTLRGAVDGSAIDAVALSDGYEQLMMNIGAEVDRQMQLIKGDTQGASTHDLWLRLDELHAAVDLYQFGGQEMMALADVWFAEATTRQLSLIELARYRTQLERTTDVFALADGEVAATWEAIASSEHYTAFGALVHETLADTTQSNDGAIDFEMLASTFGHGADRQTEFAQLVTTTTDVAQQTAAELNDEALGEIHRIALLSGLGALFAIAVSLTIARSISKPLRRLVVRAEQVRDGNLLERPLTIGGPQDLRAAASTFEQLVENLRLLESKARALSRCDLNDAVLARELPGTLGAALQESVSVLRHSIAARQELQQRLWHQANHDSLTGIPNRAAAIEALRLLLSRDPARCAVLFIDLDDFKRANDLHGHAVGDEVLRIVAARMTAAVRPDDIVARVGGDEFMAIAADIDEPGQAVALADRILCDVAQRLEVDGSQLNVTASIGIALHRLDDRPSDLLSRADLALYQAKAAGTRIHLFDESLQAQVDRRYEIESALQSALRQPDELTLHYQPIVDTQSGTVTGLEALLRWNRPGHGMVNPTDFIPIAEASTLIIDIDRWVLTNATAQLADWNRRYPDATLALSVNISGRHLLHESLVANIAEAIERSGIDPHTLTIELTESVLLDDLAHAALQLEAVRQLGVRVSIDDFGTGYTSIAHLHELPIDALKVDRSFVAQLPNTREQTLVQTLIDLAHNLNLPVVAEGVETQEQRRVLEALGCESLQGFLISAARPPEEIEAMLTTSSPIRT